jgi:hypothetical protein
MLGLQCPTSRMDVATVATFWCAQFRSIPLKSCQSTELEVAWAERSGLGRGGGGKRGGGKRGGGETDPLRFELLA